MLVSNDECVLTDTLTTYYRPMVQRAARSGHRSAFFMSVDDLEQHLWEWLIKSGHKYFLERSERMLEAGEGELSEEHKTSILRLKAKSFASKELIDYRAFNGDWLYQPKEVRELLGDMKAGGSGDLEGNVDLLEAFEMFSNSHPKAALILYRKYIDGERLAGPESVIASRGIRTLCSYMNDVSLRRKSLS